MAYGYFTTVIVTVNVILNSFHFSETRFYRHGQASRVIPDGAAAGLILSNFLFSRRFHKVFQVSLRVLEYSVISGYI